MQNSNRKIIDRVVYLTTNLITNKIYIGKDSYNYRKYFGSNKELLSDIKIHGYEYFNKQIICYCSSLDELNQKERYWIKFYREQGSNMYNINPGSGGGDTWTNNPNKEQIRAKLRVFHLGKKASIETREKMSKSQRGLKKASLKKISCIHCQLTSTVNNINRFHNDNCKYNPSIDLEKEKVRRTAWNKNKQGYLTESQRENLRQKHTIRVINRPLLTCPHCNYQGKNKGSMSRVHFENCKNKSITV